MAFPADDILLGPRSFGRLHRLDGIIWHTGEEPAFDRKYAVSTAIYQLTHPGSYNFRVYDERSPGSRGGVMLNVPYLEASGGINPTSAAWAPDRFPFLAAELAKAGPCPVPGCPGPYRNPTMHHGQVSFVGRTAALNAGAAPPNYLVDALALIGWYDTLAIRGPAPLVLSKHGHWQTNRSDCGDWMYSRLVAKEEPVTSLGMPKFKAESWRATRNVPVYELAFGPLADVAISKDAELVTLAETPDMRVVCLEWREVTVNGEKHRAPARIGIVKRWSGIDPTVQGGDPAFDARVGATVYGWDSTADCEGAVVQAEQETRAKTNQEWRDWLATAPAAASQ